MSITRHDIWKSYTISHHFGDVVTRRAEDIETIRTTSVQKPERVSYGPSNHDHKECVSAASRVSTESSDHARQLLHRTSNCDSMNELLEESDVAGSNASGKPEFSPALSWTSPSNQFASVPLAIHMHDGTVDCTCAQRDSKRQCFGINLTFSGSSVADTHLTPTDLLQDQDEKFHVSQPHATLRRRAGFRQLRPS